MATSDSQSTGHWQKQPTDILKIFPPELVEDIFHICLDNSYSKSKSQILIFLCRVSKSWRDFVYARPLLWTTVSVEASQGVVENLHVLQRRLKRSQSAPLSVVIGVSGHPDKDALRVLFAECNRFRQLTLRVRYSSWWGDIPMEGFTQLRELTVHALDRNTEHVHVDEFKAILSSAPLLRRVSWSIADPGPIMVNGHQLHSLNLATLHVPVTRLLKVLASCPNLRNAVITLLNEPEHIFIPLKDRILLPELRSFYLCGITHLTRVLSSIQAPLLSLLRVQWLCNNGGESSLEALESLLVYSPHLESIALHEFLISEDELLSIITNNKNLVRLNVIAKRGQRKLITQRTFDLLTRQEDGSYALPELEELVFDGGLDVPDEVVLRMIESRTSPPDDMARGSRPRRARALKSICLEQCRPMADEAIFRLEAICEDCGLKATGAFACCLDWY
ncbi:hypothetical protein BDN67DRAFT_788577 [Paxillus ammoniavirescens]|nr:hypothetical protein BDN67DRAFT_788577 [Paxillus ammoniavirescens]